MTWWPLCHCAQQNRLYYNCGKSNNPPRSDTALAPSVRRKVHYFSIDDDLVYWNFFLDFGPLNLGQLYRFCSRLNEILENPRLLNHSICYYSSQTPTKRANAVFLICAWQVLYLNRTPEDALRGFQLRSRAEQSGLASAAVGPNPEGEGALQSHSLQRASVENHSTPLSSSNRSPARLPLPPFHDASPCHCTYDLCVLDCLRGLVKARSFRFFDFADFDVDEYEHFEQVENGDLNWIVKGRILAFAGPHYRRQVTPEGYCTLTPADYMPYFKKEKVGLVVRLNKKCYNESDFMNGGIDFSEHYYLDGSCPPMKTLHAVLESFEAVSPDRAFAVHCKAGLGRTGTCIGAYLMKHYSFTAAEVIGWMRVCRPGMVIGPQQHFLRDIERRMWHEGEAMRNRPQLGLKVQAMSPEKGGIQPVLEKSPVAVPDLPIETLTVGEGHKMRMQDDQRMGMDDEAGFFQPGQGTSLLTRRTQAQLQHQHQHSMVAVAIEGEHVKQQPSQQQQRNRY